MLILLCASAVTGVSVLACAQGDTETKKPAKSAEQPYALIYGTVWGPDNRPLYGVKVKIRPADKKRPHWELYSDHRGEFAQRVPVGPSDYLISADLKGYKTQQGRTLELPEDVKVHITYDEREDIGVHLTY